MKTKILTVDKKVKEQRIVDCNPYKVECRRLDVDEFVREGDFLHWEDGADPALGCVGTRVPDARPWWRPVEPITVGNEELRIISVSEILVRRLDEGEIIREGDCWGPSALGNYYVSTEAIGHEVGAGGLTHWYRPIKTEERERQVVTTGKVRCRKLDEGEIIREGDFYADGDRPRFAVGRRTDDADTVYRPIE